MITELRIAGLGVIDDATIELDPGFTVVTGETGAGKTMIVSSLSLLLGDRADPKAVRHGAGQARVEGRFAHLPAGMAERVASSGGELDDAELLISRVVTAAGRSRARLGGAQVPVGVCAELVADLVTIHGQSEQIRLGNADRQREIVDRFAGIVDEVGAYHDLWNRHRALAARLAELRAQSQARAREADLLRFGLDEIARAEPHPGEDVELAAEATRLQAADDLRLAVQQAVQALVGAEDEPDAGALTGAARARRALEQGAPADPTLAALAARAAEVTVLITDLAGDLSGYLADLDADPAALETITARRAELAGLTRKYGTTLDEVLAWAETSAARLAELDGSDDAIAGLAAELAGLQQDLTVRAARITAARREAGAVLADRVHAELADLAMPHARIEFHVEPAGADDHGEPQLGPYGADRVELLFTANRGSEPRPLGRVASGGELSRVRLALEVVLADGAGQTLVFDEVDAGVGGRVAVEIGRRLAQLARTAQVIVVTHLAQVAAFADRHWVVEKSDDGQVTTSGVREVSDRDRAGELARMMAGLGSDTALAHAEELVELARPTARSSGRPRPAAGRRSAP